MITIPPTIKLKDNTLITWYSYTAKGLHIVCGKSQRKIYGRIVQGKKYTYLSTNKLFVWPIRITVQFGGKSLLCVLTGGQWVYMFHCIKLWYKNKVIARWALPYKWYQWKVLMRSKKLFWYSGKMHD